LSDMPALEREPELQRRAAEEARRSFDLAHGPLVRASLLRLDREEHVVLLVMHHIVSDGWSLGVVLREMTALYQAFAEGEPSPLPPLPVQYADYAVWQQQWLAGERLTQQLAYWKECLAGAPASLDLPTDHPRPRAQTYRGATLPFALPAELSDSLLGLAQRTGCTRYMVLLAAFQALLNRYTGQEDICVGTPVAGPGREETEGLIGFLANTLVLRTDLSVDPTFRELLGRVRETALGAYAHQDVPFERLVEELQPERDISRPPLFQVLFALDHDTSQPTSFPGLS